jgi:hypothetical protein
MKKKITFYILLAMVSVVVLSDKSIAMNQDYCSDYPLQKGNSWTYQGNTKWAEGNSVVESQPIVKMQISKVIKRGLLTVAMVEGDFNDYRNEGSSQPSVHLIMRTEKETYYDMTDDETKAVLERIKDPNDNPDDLLEGYGEAFLDMPLTVGKTFGDIDQIKRNDQLYCWVVIEEKDVDLSNIKGLEAIGKRKQYTICYSTLPDEVLIDFVSGVGITGYRYKHHGSIDEADLRLVEVNIGF